MSVAADVHCHDDGLCHTHDGGAIPHEHSVATRHTSATTALSHAGGAADHCVAQSVIAGSVHTHTTHQKSQPIYAQSGIYGSSYNACGANTYGANTYGGNPCGSYISQPQVMYKNVPYKVSVPTTKTIMVKKFVPTEERKYKYVTVPVTKKVWQRVPVETTKKVRKAYTVTGTKQVMVPKKVSAMKCVTKYKKVAYVPSGACGEAIPEDACAPANACQPVANSCVPDPCGQQFGGYGTGDCFQTDSTSSFGGESAPGNFWENIFNRGY